MKASKLKTSLEKQRAAAGRVSQPGRKASSNKASAVGQACLSRGGIDASSRQTAQARQLDSMFSSPLQRQPEEELQGKFVHQQNSDDGGSTAAGDTGIPESVQAKMEGALNTSFSDVKVHANSGKATDVGALAYTQGSDVHFAPGQYNPNTSTGKKLLGHELTHVVQQAEGRVQPTGEVAGLPLNDSPALESEADSMGSKAV